MLSPVSLSLVLSLCAATPGVAVRNGRTATFPNRYSRLYLSNPLARLDSGRELDGNQRRSLSTAARALVNRESQNLIKSCLTCSKGIRCNLRKVRANGMFDNLSNSLTSALSSIGKDEKLTAENIKKPLKQIRRALLEADVSLPVVRRFVSNVEEKVLRMNVQISKALTPDQQLIKVVYEELTDLMGSKREELVESEGSGPRIVLMAGLQGVGKTTQTGKLALLLSKQKQRVLLASLDIYRPAAMAQLKTLAERVGVDMVEPDIKGKPREIAKNAVQRAGKEGYDVVILDTAGRLQIDDDMIQELKDVKETVRPTDTLLVVDSMTGQEAAKVVKAFSDAVDLTGAILTKMDGDARGGAALSVKEVGGKPIKFVGVGEGMGDLDPFYPDRMAQRILGMGDMMTLIEKAEAAVSDKDAKSMEEKLKDGSFDFNDFQQQFSVLDNMGPMSQIAKMIPGLKIDDKQLTEGEKRIRKFRSIIQSMTKKERANPKLFNRNAAGSYKRRLRIARGSGRTLADVDELITSLKGMKNQIGKMMGVQPKGIKYRIPTDMMLVPRFTQKELKESKAELVAANFFNIERLEARGLNMSLAPWHKDPEAYPDHYVNQRRNLGRSKPS
mmetsp:Transcript_29640/g.72224  ORF Transcript_29640/g.72224 Transcript_29640/m.72224 type:complete len:614 (+) Transcript_29640:175-2016(+)